MPPEQRIRDLLISYLDGEVPVEVQRLIENKIYTDDEVKAEIEEFKAVKRALGQWRTPEVSPEFSKTILERVKAGDIPVGYFDSE